MARDYGAAVDVAIVGGGIIGCSLAYELSRNGMAVAIVERDAIGCESSGAASGLLAPPSEMDLPPIRADLIAQSILAYPEYIARVEQESGIDVGFRLCGELNIARDEQELQELKHLLDWYRTLGLRSDWLDRETARDLEPSLAEDVLAGVLTHDAGTLFSDRLTRAIAIAAERQGVRIIEHSPALAIELDGRRAVGVRLNDGRLVAGQVVLAAGAWTNAFGRELGIPLPTLPVRGQNLAIANAPVTPNVVIGRLGGGHIIPRSDGTVTSGSTRSYAGFDKRVIAEDIRWCLDLAAELCPGLLTGEVVHIWAGLRPSTSDEEPIVGQVPGYERLWVTTGHYHTGVQIAVMNADLLATSILVGKLDPRLSSFSPVRFVK